MSAKSHSQSGLPQKSDDGLPTTDKIEIVSSPPSPLAVDGYADVSYGSGGLKGVLQSPYIFSVAFLASMGGFSFGYDQGVMSIINIMPQFLEVFPKVETSFWKGFMTGMLELGACIGCFFMPWLADKISRKRAIAVAVVIFNVGAILQTAAVNYGMLVVGRTIGGIGVGTLAMGAPLYISEIAPPNLRGTLLVLESISIVLGVVIAFWITYGTRHMAGEISFRLPIGLQMVSATVVGVGLGMFPYSPRWLALVNRHDEALLSLARLRRLPTTDDRVQAEYQGIIIEDQFQKALQQRKHPGLSGLRLEVQSWLDLFDRKIWRRLAVGCGVLFFQQFSGINAFIYYAPTLFESLGQSPEMALIMSGIFNMLQLVAVSICFFIIDKVGRRPLAIWGGVGEAVTWGIMAVLVGVYSKSWDSHPDAGWAAVAMAFLFILIYGTTYAPLGWALPSEIFPNALRSKGVALSTATNWICNFIIGVITPPMLEAWGYGTYIFFAAFCALASVWAFFLVPETAGKTLEQMDEVFGNDIGLEERRIFEATAENFRQQMHAGSGHQLD